MYQNLGKFSEPTKKWVVFLCSAPNYSESQFLYVRVYKLFYK